MTIIVADLSHHNWDNGMNPDFVVSKNAGLGGIIYKASQGSDYRDPTYNQTRELVESAGLLWGAYHFGTVANTKSQAQNFITATQPDDNCLVCLDFEANESDPSSSITLTIALEFQDRIAQKLGRKPKLYTGPFMYDLFGAQGQAGLANFQVWWARYATEIDLHPTWENYWLWQYTDGHSGPKPHKFGGIGFCDLSQFDGTLEELSQQWSG